MVAFQGQRVEFAVLFTESWEDNRYIYAFMYSLMYNNSDWGLVNVWKFMVFFPFLFSSAQLLEDFTGKSKVGDCRRGWPEGSVFNSYAMV